MCTKRSGVNSSTVQAIENMPTHTLHCRVGGRLCDLITLPLSMQLWPQLSKFTFYRAYQHGPHVEMTHTNQEMLSYCIWLSPHKAQCATSSVLDDCLGHQLQHVLLLRFDGSSPVDQDINCNIFAMTFQCELTSG